MSARVKKGDVFRYGSEFFEVLDPRIDTINWLEGRRIEVYWVNYHTNSDTSLHHINAKSLLKLPKVSSEELKNFLERREMRISKERERETSYTPIIWKRLYEWALSFG